MVTRMGSSGMVVGPHPDAADAGLEILKAGGNAIDAAVAAAFTVAVVEPANTGIAGYGGCIVAYIKELDRCISVNFDSRAPARSTGDMFDVVESGDGAYRVQNMANVFGPLSVGVPAVLAGLAYVLRRYGRASLNAVTRNAIAAARDGFVVNRGTATGISDVVEPLKKGFHETAKLVLPDGSVPDHGDVLRFPELAETLSTIAREGTDVFYRGELGGRVVEYLDDQGGILEADDLRRYEPIESRPPADPYRGREVLTPPLCSGGLTTLQMLKVLEGFQISDNAPGSPGLYHLLVEVMKASWRERLSRYGDPDHVSIDERSELGPGAVERLGAAGAWRPGAPGTRATDLARFQQLHQPRLRLRPGGQLRLSHSHPRKFAGLARQYPRYRADTRARGRKVRPEAWTSELDRASETAAPQHVAAARDEGRRAPPRHRGARREDHREQHDVLLS